VTHTYSRVTDQAGGVESRETVRIALIAHRPRLLPPSSLPPPASPYRRCRICRHLSTIAQFLLPTTSPRRGTSPRPACFLFRRQN
jgi:hypothetical protein